MAVEVFIVAGVRLYRQGLIDAFEADPRFTVAGGAADRAGAVAHMRRLPRLPAVALLDVGLGAGVPTARRLRAELPDVKLVALILDDTDESVIAWAEAGVAGFVTREMSLEELMRTVECVADGGAWCPPRAVGALVNRLATLADARRPTSPRTAHLTPREREIVGLIDRGLSNKQIARELHIELATVKNHVHSVLEKLHVERRGAAAAAMRGSV
jgi:DNA-binding NarL/FixJ family response regulator